MLARGFFNWRARGIAEPFYVLCGYGESGAGLAHALDQMGSRMVIVDPSAERTARVAVQDYATPPLALTADARLADVLEDCGIRNAHCLGLIALAGDDGVNQAIAIGARVLNPSIPIVARAKSAVAKVNLESFGGVQVINPVRDVRVESRREPALAGDPADRGLAHRGAGFARVRPPYSRRGDAGCSWASAGSAMPSPKCSTAKGSSSRRSIRAAFPIRTSDCCTAITPENMLRDAGIESADVLVAGSDIDSVNLGATTLARRVRPDIFVVIRQNQMQDRALVEAARANLKFVESELMVHECLQVLTTPILGRFIAELRIGRRLGRRSDAGPGSARSRATARRTHGRSNATSCSPACSTRSSSEAAPRSGSPTWWRIRHFQRSGCAPPH